MVEASDTPPVTISVGFDHQALRRSGARRDRRPASRLRVPRADRQPAGRGAAAEAGLALRRAVRRLLGRADLLRVEGGARARHGGALGRRRRRALGRLRPAPRRALGAARRAARSGPPRAPPAGSARRCRSRSRARGRCAISRSDPAQAYALKHAYGMFEPDAKSRLYSGDFRRQRQRLRSRSPPSATPIARCASLDPLDRALYVDARTYMIDDILTKVDRMSMAVSLEAREPLLDHKLLEFAARGADVAEAEERPEQVPAAPGARAARAARRSSSAASSGFAAPIGDWLRGPLAPMANELLLDGRLRDRGIFNDREVARLWHEHRSRPRRPSHIGSGSSSCSSSGSGNSSTDRRPVATGLAGRRPPARPLRTGAAPMSA